MINTAASNVLNPISTVANSPDIGDSALYYRPFYEAEEVRWKMSDIPWSDINKDKVTPSLVSLVRDIAYAELTTWSSLIVSPSQNTTGLSTRLTPNKVIAGLCKPRRCHEILFVL